MPVASRKAAVGAFRPTTVLLQRKTRSGATFSEVVSAVVLNGVDVSTLLAARIAEQDASGHDDPEIKVLSGRPLPDDDPDDERPIPPTFQPLPDLPAPPMAVLNSNLPNVKTRWRVKKEEKRRRKRAAAAPYVKGVGAQRLRDAQKRAIRVATDTAALPHSKPAWTGHRNAPGPDADLAADLNGFDWTQANLGDALAALGMQYVDWRSGDSIPIYDVRRRLLALLAGHPRGDSWPGVIAAANDAVEKAAPRIRLSAEKRAHRRAADEFPALARGISHGGGQTEPGELLVQGANKRVTDELLKNDAFKSIVGFTTYIFQLWMPLLFGAYHLMNLALAEWAPALRLPFAGSVFAACTWNFVTTVCAPHVDFANLAWGWCAITALGRFNPDRGGHLILWDLRLVIRFPPGSTIFMGDILYKKYF